MLTGAWSGRRKILSRSVVTDEIMTWSVVAVKIRSPVYNKMCVLSFDNEITKVADFKNIYSPNKMQMNITAYVWHSKLCSTRSLGTGIGKLCSYRRHLTQLFARVLVFLSFSSLGSFYFLPLQSVLLVIIYTICFWEQNKKPLLK